MADESRFAPLARHLEALASETRLELLHALRTPQALHEIRIQPSDSRAGDQPDRPLTRQAIARHLEQLQEAGLLRRLRDGPKERGEEYVLNHERLFALVDEMRGLARLRPLLHAPLRPGETLERLDARGTELPPVPRMVMAFGRDDGVAFGLSGPAGSRWRGGRGAHCEIRLDYDPFLSSEHFSLERTLQGFLLTDAGSKNGTWVNWDRLPPAGSRVLRAGDLVTAGRCVLAFQA